MKNIFMRDGQLQVGGVGRLASLNDLNESLCMGNPEIRGLLQTSDGVVSWYNTNEMETEEDNLENGEVMEYIEHRHIKTLYTEFKEDTADEYEEIVSLTSDEHDMLLNVVTRGMSNNTIKVYNYYRNDGKIIKEDTTCHISMFRDLFRVMV